MTQMVPFSFSTRRAADSHARVNASYSAKLLNLSQLLSTASTLLRLGRYRSFCSCRLYGGSANTKSAEFSGSELRISMQLPERIWLRGRVVIMIIGWQLRLHRN